MIVLGEIRMIVFRFRCVAWLAMLLAGLGLSALSGCAWIDAKQRALIYRPTPGSLQDWQALTPRDELLWLTIGQQASRPAQAREGVRAIWVPQRDPDAPAVLYLHGTFRNVFQNRPKIAAIHSAGFAVLAVDYRGFGDSSPTLPSEDSIDEDAEAAWEEFVRRVPEPSRRAVFGHSLGSAVAIELAWRHRASPGIFGALVLESAFTSLPAIARDTYPWAAFVDLLATQHFDSLDKIGQIDTPTWLMAGTADNTVPSTQSRRLYDAAGRPCALVMFEGGSHSSLHHEFKAAYRKVWAGVAAQMRAANAAACRPGESRVVHVDGKSAPDDQHGGR